MALSPATRLGPVHLVVTDLERSADFYADAIGLRLHGRENGVAVLGAGGEDLLVLYEQPGARPPGGHAGLYHFALLHPSRTELARAARRLAVTRTAIQGASDHGFSEAIYLADPDGNGIELYADRPREVWPDVQDAIRPGGPLPLDLHGLLELAPEDGPADPGLQAVVQSVRGTFGSGGEFNPFDERADGLSTIAWLERQPWYEGPLGMTGSSYLGLTQWAVAQGGSIGALTPSVTASQFHGQGYGGGSIALASALSWVVIVAAQERRFATLRMLMGLRRLPRILDNLPLGELDALTAGRPLGFYAEWLSHSAADDPYWAARDYSAGVAEVSAAVQLVGGWHDIFLPWMLEDHAALESAGRSPQLIVGPWTHTSPGLLEASMREGLAWLRAHLLGDRRLLNDAPVRVFVGGAQEWRELPAWPPPEARPLRLHLHAGGGLGVDPPADSPPDGY